MWKMIVLDLDGTVLDFKRKISKETKAFLSKLKEQGYIIVIATGRILGLALDVTDGADFANYLLTDTGAMIYKREGFERILANTIDKDTAKDILNNYTEDYSYINICSPEFIYSYSKIRLIIKRLLQLKILII